MDLGSVAESGGRTIARKHRAVIVDDYNRGFDLCRALKDQSDRWEIVFVMAAGPWEMIDALTVGLRENGQYPAVPAGVLNGATVVSIDGKVGGDYGPFSGWTSVMPEVLHRIGPCFAALSMHSAHFNASVQGNELLAREAAVLGLESAWNAACDRAATTRWRRGSSSDPFHPLFSNISKWMLDGRQPAAQSSGANTLVNFSAWTNAVADLVDRVGFPSFDSSVGAAPTPPHAAP